MFVVLLLGTLTLIFYAIYLTSKRKLQYWERKNIPYEKPLTILGNFADYILQKKYIGQVAQKLCQKFQKEPIFGAYYGTEPTLYIQDPELIKLVITKDFYYFNGRENSEYSHKEMATRTIFFDYGDNWKLLRQNMTPLFSSAKMKNMFYLIDKCAHVFENMLNQEDKTCNEIEVTKLMARFTMDCIGSCGFGVSTNTMEKTENNPFRQIGDVIFDTRMSRGLKIAARAIWPSIFYGLGFKLMPDEVGKFFTNLLTDVFRGRQYKPTTRNDFVDFILKISNNKTITGDSLKNLKSDSKKKVSIEVDEEFLIAQCFVFFAAGYGTSATTLSHTLFELAKNPDAQEKALKEVDEYLFRNNNTLKYECVAETPYLGACFEEALRLYPVLGILTREVVEDYTFPSGLKVDKGVRVHLPLYHLHHNPEFFPEPEKYRPERFFGEEKKNIRPYTYMPFGEGPRICIGMRFAKMQMTAGMITLLKKYRVALAPGMKTELEFEPGAFGTQPKGGIRLNFIKREGWEQRKLNGAQ